MIANLITALGLLTAATFGAPATTSRVDVSRLQGIIFPTIGSPFAPSDAASSDDMHYNMGNPVLTGDVNIYHIYYGNVTSYCRNAWIYGNANDPPNYELTVDGISKIYFGAFQQQHWIFQVVQH
jgi:hypothetical protein